VARRQGCPVKTFVRATEVWVPGRDRATLELGSGLYGDAIGFAAASQSTVFRHGEGLPGRAWQEGRPIILQRFEGSYFQRTAAAHADGITCGIAVPIHAGDFLSAVLVIFCGDDADQAGAIELWHHDGAVSPDMRLADGCYGRTGDTFETVSRRLSLRRGSGLPGMAWERDGPVFMADLGKGAGLLRADSATRVGTNRGFAFPCPGPSAGHETWVMAFLSALGTPLVRRFEVWEPDANRTGLRRDGGFCEAVGMLGGLPDGAAVRCGEGSLGRVMLSGVPVLCDALADEPLIGADATAAGLHSLVSLPIIRGGHLHSVIAWYF
jgi:hypothetical protein